MINPSTNGKNLRAYKQKLAAVDRLWGKKKFDLAFVEVERLRQAWPGNAHVLVLWACLLQMQNDDAPPGLEEAKQALRQAIELDPDSPAAAIELGYFLDNVEDDPRGAAKAFADGVASARRLLLEGLIGHAKALLQIDKKDEARRCALEALRLLPDDAGPQSFGDEIETLLGEVFANRSA